jgi:hypothetical protein
VQHLGDDEPLRHARPPAPSVVGRYERPQPGRHVLHRLPLDRQQARADEASLPHLPDHVEAVGEAVEPERVEPQRPGVRRIEREDAPVAVAGTREDGQAHQLDEELVLLERIGARRQLVGGRP